MTPTRPYLIRAFYDWIVDNGFTPYMLVDAGVAGVIVPTQFVQEGKIVLNLSPTAVRNLDLGNQEVRFGARFSGVAMEVRVPPAAVLGIYAHENGRGMLFPAEEEPQAEPTPPDAEPEPPRPPRERPTLKVIK
jgi:stringent starvation protein B